MANHHFAAFAKNREYRYVRCNGDIYGAAREVILGAHLDEEEHVRLVSLDHGNEEHEFDVVDQRPQWA